MTRAKQYHSNRDLSDGKLARPPEFERKAYRNEFVPLLGLLGNARSYVSRLPSK